MVAVIEMLGGILRYFPNTMITTLFFVGVATGKLSWILVAIGGIVITILTLTLQYTFQKSFGIGPLTDRPGAAIIKACSLLPDAIGGEYIAEPSLWVALSSFFITYIFMNAKNIYTQQPSRANKDKLGVQQRKGVGLISMLAVVVLGLFLIVPRYWTKCENKRGFIIGLVIGLLGGFMWWNILNACGPDVFPDIHGVMIGLKPGSIRTNPMVCAPTVKK